MEKVSLEQAQNRLMFYERCIIEIEVNPGSDSWDGDIPGVGLFGFHVMGAYFVRNNTQ